MDKMLAAEIIEICLQMNTSGLNQGCSGNVSVRQQDGFLITPSGINYECLTSDDIVKLEFDYCGEMDGEASRKPSSEWRLHKDIYQHHEKALAVLHAHPTYCVALASHQRIIPAFHYMVAVAGGIDIRCADYATFGTQALSDAMLLALKDRKACLLANHGMICFARDLQQVLSLAIEVETLARQYWHALQLGSPTLLSEQQMTEVIEKFSSYGQQCE